MKQYATLGLVLLMIIVQGVSAVYQTGDLVDDFTLPDSNGDLYSLYSNNGLVVLIFFWGPC